MIRQDKRTGVYTIERDYTDLRELTPVHSGQRSFYCKAWTADALSDRGHRVNVLWSYGTPVAAYDGDEFIQLWGGWSQTTMRHVNEYRAQHGDRPMRKAEWEAMELGGEGIEIPYTPPEARDFRASERY